MAPGKGWVGVMDKVLGLGFADRGGARRSPVTLGTNSSDQLHRPTPFAFPKSRAKTQKKFLNFESQDLLADSKISKLLEFKGESKTIRLLPREEDQVA
ncbi:MAG: hypothetical protein IPG67_16850 [Acidobacteria bacterium]|nr:hypothetical protein [Acidobacteriota bacterium]